MSEEKQSDIGFTGKRESQSNLMRSALPSDQRGQDEEQGKKGKRSDCPFNDIYDIYDTASDCTAWLAVTFLLLLDNAMYQDVFVAFSLALVATIFRHTSVSSTYPCPCVGR